MSVRTKLPAIAIVASCFLLPLAAPNGAAAEACLTAPKGQAPEGSHWYYRLERPSMRKCWRLVARAEEGSARTASRSAQQEQRAQKPVEEMVPQGDIEDETEAAPAPTPPAVRIVTAQAKPAAVQTTPVQNPAADNWGTREAPLPLPPPALTPDAAPRADTPAPPVQLAQSESAPTVIAEPPAAPPAHGKSAKASEPEGTSLLNWLPALLALLGLAGGAVFYVTRVMRRRSDVLAVMQDVDSPALEPSAEPMADEPTFAPLPPIGLSKREDDVEEALRRFAENWKRRAA